MARSEHGYEKFKIDEIRRVLQEEYEVFNEDILKQTKVPLINLLVSLQEAKEKEEEEEREVENLRRQLENMIEEEEETTNVGEEEDNENQDEYDNDDEDGDEDEDEDKDESENGYEEEQDNTGEIDLMENQQDTNLVDDKTNVNIGVHFYSEGWSDYVLGLFSKGELVDGHPTCDGCRRLVNQLIGPIVESGVAQIIPAMLDNYGTTTVVFQIKVAVDNEFHPLQGKVIHMEDVADCNKYNTDSPYNKYLSATASTRAEGRILRKILGLKTVIAEETSTKENEDNDDWQPDSLITSSQEACIGVMCQRLDLNIEEFINSGKNTYSSIKEIPYYTAVAMIKELNNIQRQVKERPPAVGQYKEKE